MVTLNNIIKDGNFISTDYFLEANESDIGHIEYDINSNKVIEFKYSQEDEQSNIKYGYHKAIAAIKLLIKYNKFPPSYKYMWY